jgi:hypothetical protein
MQHNSSNLWRKKLKRGRHARQQGNTHSSNNLWRKRLKRETTFPCCRWLELEPPPPPVLELQPPLPLESSLE